MNQQSGWSPSRNDCDTGGTSAEASFSGSSTLQRVGGAGFSPYMLVGFAPQKTKLQVFFCPSGEYQNNAGFSCFSCSLSSCTLLSTGSQKKHHPARTRASKSNLFLHFSGAPAAAEVRALRSLLRRAGPATVPGSSPGLNSKPPTTRQLVDNKLWLCLHSKTKKPTLPGRQAAHAQTGRMYI